MEASQSSVRASTSHINVELAMSTPTKVTRPSTIQKFTPKTNLPMVANSRQAERAGAVSRAGKHRWPQATMVVMGRTERHIINTEMLSVSTETKSKLDNLKTTERSNNETATNAKTFLPDIVPSGQADAHEDSNQISIRFAARSPSKLSQLPKGLVNAPHGGYEIKEEGKSKLIKSIKFWRGTTPTAKEFDAVCDLDKVDEKHSSKHIAKTSDILTKQDSILQSWAEQSSVSEESQHRYFSWHMALRERLLKHEKMHYHEAVARINKYRQRLKQRPGLMPSRELLPNMDVQIWKNLIQQHGDKKKTLPATANQQPTVSMSPSQEWKPFVLNENDTENTKRRPPFFGKQASLLNEAAKKQVKLNGSLQSSSSKRPKRSTSTDKPDTKYPVHGEGLLRDESANAANVLPSIIATSPQNKKINKPTKVELTSDSEENDHGKSATRALLVDLKNQLRPKTNQGQEQAREYPDRGSTAPSQQTKTSLGAKLKLLLQNSAPPQPSRGESVRFSSTAAQQVRPKLQSQQSGYRPMSRPRTIGDGSLPKIHNIATSSLWKRQIAGNKDGEPNVKHRLTLAGVASRESFSSSVIGIAQKHITNRPQQLDVRGKNKPKKADEPDDKAKKPKNDGKILENRPAEVMSGTTQSNETENTDKNSNEKEGVSAADKSLKKKNPAFRLYTPATILQHQFGSSASASRMQERENPQYKSLKLITTMAGKQQSPPRTPLERFNARQTALKGKAKLKPAGKHKVLRIAVVEPPLTTKERIQRQQQIEKNIKRLTFNPTHAAVNNFTRAILNSELDLRAPSSSPVDMFYRQHTQHAHDYSGDAWGSQKAVDGLQHGGKTKDGLHPETQYGYRQLPVNQTDGLMPPKRNLHLEGLEVHGIYGNANVKASSAPKVKDLVDLQRLYHVMKKHGEAYTNGAAYFFSQSPNMQEGIAKQQVIKQHTNQKNLHKTPYYYYPYQGGDGQDQVMDDKGDTALYVVTGAHNMNGNRRLGHIQPSNAKYSASEEETRPHNPTVPFRHVLTLNKDNLPHWEQSHRQKKAPSSQDFKQSSKHALTVMMPKTPGMPMTTTLPLNQQHALEQIQEHVLQ